MNGLSGFPRQAGRPGVRDRLLVLPSVICSTLVSRRIADSVGGVTITHQDGCGHIGDDVDHAHSTYASLACHPNIAGTLLVSLGCETVQGSLAAQRIADTGVPVQFLRIQDYGAAEAEAEGTRIAGQMIATMENPRTTMAPADLLIGVHLARHSALAAQFLKHLVTLGVAACVAGPAAHAMVCGLQDAWEELGHGETATGSRSVLVGPAIGSQHLAELAIAGAQVIVSFPDEVQPPVSFPVCPVVTVAGSSGLHTALADDFDATEEPDAATSATGLWELVSSVVGGMETIGERSGHRDFSLPRLRRTM